MLQNSSKIIICDGFQAGAGLQTYAIHVARRRILLGGRIDSKSTIPPNPPNPPSIRRESAVGGLNPPLGEFRNELRNHGRIEFQKLPSGICRDLYDSYGHLFSILKQSTSPRSASKKPQNHSKWTFFCVSFHI